jgi:hypothetical protein
MQIKGGLLHCGMFGASGIAPTISGTPDHDNR